MITRLSLIFITLFFTLLPIFSQTKEEVKVELKFSIDTRFGLAKGLFRKSSLLIKDRKQGTGIVEIDVASIDTNNSMRDNHLRDEDFFSVQKFPKAEFEILSLTESSADTVSGNGKLTLKGISKEYTFQATVSKTADSEKYTGTIKINRRDYGMVYQSLINPIEDIANLEFTVTLPLKK
ncbi:MAG: YceI family protein [Leptospiraceae bacterium]|nr:YceI family protein [Leptospiraceae bacterium]